jgi:hypothetical protein
MTLALALQGGAKVVPPPILVRTTAESLAPTGGKAGAIVGEVSAKVASITVEADVGDTAIRGISRFLAPRPSAIPLRKS